VIASSHLPFFVTGFITSKTLRQTNIEYFTLTLSSTCI